MREAPRETPGLPFGELFRERRHLRGDIRLLRRAIREGWPIPEDARRVLLAKLAEVFHAAQEDTDLPEGTRLRILLQAAWTALDAEKVNIRADHHALGLKVSESLRPPHRRRFPTPDERDEVTETPSR